MESYAFWNNKGGTGKTSLIFQVSCNYARHNPRKKVLVVDVCPQANLSELFLGGLTGGGSKNLLMRQGTTIRSTIGGYFQLRLPSPYTAPIFSPEDFLTNPSEFNPNIPENILLLCGDPMLELQSNAMNTLANAQIPGTNSWISIVDWLRQFLSTLKKTFDIVFIDVNPSFSIYTQIALSAAKHLILPVMADDSSRRALQNAFSLIYGFKLPSPIYATYAFSSKLSEAKRPLPKVHIIVKNRLTQYMGAASAYGTVLKSIEKEVGLLLTTNPTTFTFKEASNAIVEIRDFQTTGVVSFAKGCPFYHMKSGKISIDGKRIVIKNENLKNCVKEIDALTMKL